MKKYSLSRKNSSSNKSRDIKNKITLTFVILTIQTAKSVHKTWRSKQLIT